MAGTLNRRDAVTGTWQSISTAGPIGQRGPIGPMGVTGPTGAQGISSVIIGDFGATTTPVDLPTDGLIPVDWDGPGNPATEFQVELGQSLYYDKPTDAALDGHLYQYVGTGVHPDGWLDIGLIQGPEGPLGPTGPTGPMGDDVFVGPDDPTVVKPTVELWYDTDDTRILGPVDLPTGGTVDQALVKASDIDGDVEWAGPHVPYNVPAGKKIQFTNEEGPKINLYGSTFGMGITASTLAFYTGGVFRFRRDSTTGTEYAWIDSTGMGPRTTYTVTWINGFSGTCDYRVTPTTVTLRLHGVKRNINTEVGAQTKMHDYPVGVPAPPNIGPGYDVVTFTLQGNNFSTDPPKRGLRLHLDATGLWVIPVNDLWYANDHAIYEVITWSR